MQVANIAIWDIETGGFNKRKNGLAEFAIIVIDSTTLQEIDRYETIIAPYEIPDENDPKIKTLSTYEQGALNVNGLTMKQINNGKEAKIAFKEIAAFCKKHKKSLRGGAGKLIPAGHNLVKFDIPYLKEVLSFFNIKYSDLFNDLVIDTLLWTRLRWSADGSIPNHKLGTACEAAGVKLIDAHKAINDVEGNTEFLRIMIQSMRNQKSSINKTVERPRKHFRF